MKRILLVLAAALLLGSLTQAQTFNGKEFPISLGGGYDLAAKRGASDLRAGYFFTRHLGVEVGADVQRSVNFGGVLRLPIERLNLALYVRGGGAYAWNPGSALTTTPGGSYYYDQTTALPCQSGTPGATLVTDPGTTSEVDNARWTGYVGPGLEWRPRGGKLGLFVEGVRSIGRTDGDGFTVLGGLRYSFGGGR